MTTNRFTIQGQSIKHHDELLTLNMVCEMLNDYAEENEELIQELKELEQFQYFIFKGMNERVEKEK